MAAPKGKGKNGKPHPNTGNQFAKGNKGGGRKTLYKKEYAEQARKLCEMGFTDQMLARFFEVEERTIQRWRCAQPEFKSALKVGKAEADDIVERSTFIAINGHTRTITETRTDDEGRETKTEKEVYYPPNAGIGLKWLAVRRPEVYANKQEGEATTVLAEGLKAALIEMTHRSREKRAERAKMIELQAVEVDGD